MQVPRWLLVAIAATAAVVTITWRAANEVSAQIGRVTKLEEGRVDDNLRMCRWERAFQQRGFPLEPWHTCPDLPVRPTP